MIGAPLFGLVTTPENFIKTQMQLDNVQSEREKMKKQYLAQGQEESQKLLLDPYDNNRSSSANDIVSQEKIAKSEVHPEPNI